MGASEAVYSVLPGVAGLSDGSGCSEMLGELDLAKVLLKVLRIVGEMAERVSNRRLVGPFPYNLWWPVLRVNLGRFKGTRGGCVYIVGEGRTVTEVMLISVASESGGLMATEASIMCS